MPPSCSSSESKDVVGRCSNGKNILLHYRDQCKLKLCNKEIQKQANNVYVSLFSGLSLCDYIQARGMDCEETHMQPCSKCHKVLSVALQVLNEGYMLLSSAFKQAFPDQTYKSDIAISRLLQMPLASIRIGAPESGRAKWFLIEHIEGVDYTKFAHFAEAALLSLSDSGKPRMDKTE